MRDIARKGLAPPVLLLLCLLINIWARWPILMHIDEVFTISWRVCTALVTGGISLVLSLTGLVTLISNQTTLNALHPERTSMLVTRGCFRFSRNPVYLGFIGLHIALALLLSSVIGLMITPFLILLLSILHIQVEEAGMQQLFGRQWEEYCNNTPRWFSLASLYAVIKERAVRASRGECGNISLALPVIQNAAPPITTLLKKFKKASPLVGITLHHLISEVQLSKIAEGELDAGFLLFRPLNDPLFAGIPVFKEKMLLAYPTEWKWPDNKEPRYLRELQNLDFIWLPRTAAPAWHDRLIHCFYDAGFTPRSVMHGVDAVSMLTLVSAGMGCTIVAEGMRHLAPSNVSFVVLEDLNIVQEWELVWRKDRCSEVLKSLINLI
ncbi:TPA: LysR substrate-binding domain-containing protein [Klebsiella pneumoniae]